MSNYLLCDQTWTDNQIRMQTKSNTVRVTRETIDSEAGSRKPEQAISAPIHGFVSW